METKVYNMYVARAMYVEKPNPKWENQWDDRRCYFKQIGTVKTDKSDFKAEEFAEIVWNLTNHSCWNGRKRSIECDGAKYVPTKYDRGYTNDDICFEYRGWWYIAKSYGWKRCKTLENAKKYLWKEAQWVRGYLPTNYRYKEIIV